MDTQNPDFENIQPKVKVETDWSSSKLCFICSSDISSEKEHHDNRNHCGYHQGERSRSASSVKILISYILRNTSSSSSSTEEDREREAIQRNILASFSKGNQSICSKCLSKAENLLKLHLELEKIQMQILDVLRNLQDYLKSVKGHHGDSDEESSWSGFNGNCDAMFTRFQEILVHEFMSRELSDGTEVRLERLTAAAFGMSSSSSLLVSREYNSNTDDGVGDTGGGSDPIITADIKLDDYNDGCSKKSVHHSTMDIDGVNDDDEDNDNEEDPLKESHFEDSDWNPEEADDNVSSDQDQDQGQDEDDNKEDHSRPGPLLPRTRGEKGPMTLDCEICLERIPYQEMTIHLQSHTEFEKFYECKLCPPSNRATKRTYGTFKGLIWHNIRKQHNLPIPCQLCPDSEKNILFKNGELCRHLYDFHKINHKKLSCKYEDCSMEFCDPKTLTVHHAQRHSHKRSKTKTSSRKRKAPAPPEERVDCPSCSKSISSKYELTRHLRVVHGIKKKKEFTCPVCFKIFNRQCLCKRHMERKHSEKLLTCPSCPKQFKSSFALKLHVEIQHERDKRDPVKCPQCSKEFVHDLYLRQHIKRVHEDEDDGKTGPSLQCQYCPRVFRFRQNLKTHEDIHRGERKYKCGECPFAGTTYRSLHSHKKRVHQVRRKLTCQHQDCSKTFNSREGLRLHVETIHNENSDTTFECPKCQKIFRNKYSLRSHLKFVHEKKKRKKPLSSSSVPPVPQQCQFCPKVFNLRSSLMAHENLHRRRQAKERLENLEMEMDDSIGGESSQGQLEENVSVSDLRPPPPARKHGQKGPITYDCEICLEPIPFENYKRHLKSHPEFEKFYECQVCPPSDRPTRRACGTYKGLVWHCIRRQHKIDMPCKLCPEQEQSKLFKKPELCRHLYEVHHLNHRKLSCREENCSAEFCDPKTLTCHQSKLHSGSNNNDRGKCPQCLQSILNSRLDFHLKYKCGKKSLKEIKSKKERKEALTCPIPTCGKIFKLKSRRDAHIQRAHPENLLTCSSCPKQFKSSNGLRVHEATHLGESAKVECPECQRKFTHRDLLRKHINRMHLKKPYRKPLHLQCQFCSKIFQMKYDLQLHEESHQNLRNYKCTEPECPYAANTSVALRNHLKTHQEKTLKCQFCPMMCRTKEVLGNHERTHTKERPFMCPVEGCGMSFRTRDQRGRHEKTRHGLPPRKARINPEEKKVKEKVYMCELCPKQYKDNRDLRRHREGVHGNPELVQCLYCEKMFRKHRMHYHVKAVHEEKLLRCGSCEKTFVWEDWLKLHKEQSHGIYR